MNNSNFAMRNIIIVLGLVVMSLSVFAQVERPEVEVNWGEELQEPVGTQLNKVIAASKEGIFALRVKQANNDRTKAFIEKYDENLKLKRARELDLKYKNKDRRLEDVIMLGGKLYLVTSFNNQAKRKNYLFKQPISKTRFTTNIRDLELIGEFDTRNAQNVGQFDLVQSRDTSKLLVYHQLPFKKGEPESFKLRVFDEQFEELWTRPIELPYPSENFTVEEYRVDRKGNVYIVGVVYENGRQLVRQGNPTYRYTILAYTENGTAFNEYRIDLPNYFITDFTFRVANDGNLICTGFYSERGTTSVKGTYFFKLDAKTKEISNQNLKEFDFDLLTEFMSARQRDRAERAVAEGDERRSPELYRFSLDHLILRSDGGALLIAEQFYVYERTYNYNPNFYRFNNNIRIDYFYNYNDILVINIKPTGEIEWAARIPKRQSTMNDGGFYSSYAMSIVRDKIYLIYNDNSRNFNNKSNRIFSYDGTRSVVSLVEIGMDGEWRVDPLFQNREVDILTRPKICGQVGSKEMLIYGELGRNYRFGKLKF